MKFALQLRPLLTTCYNKRSHSRSTIHMLLSWMTDDKLTHLAVITQDKGQLCCYSYEYLLFAFCTNKG